MVGSCQVRFRVSRGGTQVGADAAGVVTAGSASVALMPPAGSRARAYGVDAAYPAGGNF